jgi:hypothetical protein
MGLRRVPPRRSYLLGLALLRLWRLPIPAAASLGVILGFVPVISSAVHGTEHIGLIFNLKMMQNYKKAQERQCYMRLTLWDGKGVCY